MPEPKNQLGYFAAQAVELTVKSLRTCLKSLDIENNSEEEILDALDIINRMSWEAKGAIQRDLSERKDRQEAK